MTAAQPAAPKRPKTAVVVVHGMGEQKPMATLRAFVKALWTDDEAIWKHASKKPEDFRKDTFSKPDRITGSFELRRITTLSGSRGRRADFFEFYWQHLMRGNNPTSVLAWVARLALRLPDAVPAPLRPLWAILWISAFAAAAGAAYFYSTDLQKWFGGLGWWNAVVLGALSAAGAGFAWFSSVWVGPVLGDATRYFEAAPDNVHARQSIREAGVDLIVKLHDSGQYDRIVVVAHSLGTAIALDALYHAFARIEGNDWVHALGKDPAMRAAVEKLDKATARLAPARSAPADACEIRDFRLAQRDAFAHLRAATKRDGKPLWLVSDFVTLGSPLTYADTFILDSYDAFDATVRARETAVCPPVPDAPSPKNQSPGFLYENNGNVIPHHASPFALTAWTNIYFDSFLAAAGDVIGGSLRRLYGPGVKNVPIPNSWYFQHNSYWLEEASIKEMRQATDLQETSFSTKPHGSTQTS